LLGCARMYKLNVLIRVTLCFLFVFLPLQSMDEWFFDRFFSIRGELNRPPSDIVLVEVNDAGFVSFSEGFQSTVPEHSHFLESKSHTVWYRAFYEKLLTLIQSQAPRAIVF